MDSICTAISASELVTTAIGSNWPMRTAMTVPTSPRVRLLELSASCPQGAQPSVRTDQQFKAHSVRFGQQDEFAQEIKHVNVMGGSYVADDTFGTRWGSSPGRPPE